MKSLDETRLSPEEAKAALATSVHESGHYLLADRFGLEPSIALWGPGDGLCQHRPGSREESEVICWSGLMSEDLLKCRRPGRTRPLTDLTAETLPQWIEEVMQADRANELHTIMSHTDRSEISGYGSRTGPPLFAYNMLSSNLDELRAVADYSLKVYMPSIVLARNCGSDFIRARAANPDPKTPPKANTATMRLAPLEEAYRELAKAAQKAEHEAHQLTSDLDKVWPLSSAASHSKGAALHSKAGGLHLQAKEAALEHNRAWALEFERCLSAGDNQGARTAARRIYMKSPWSHQLSADHEFEKAARQTHKGRSSCGVSC